jgi:hypothetical protein
MADFRQLAFGAIWSDNARSLNNRTETVPKRSNYTQNRVKKLEHLKTLDILAG